MVRRPPISTRTDTLLPRTTLYRSPRRAVVGWDSGRLARVLAVLEARCGLQMGAAEVYLNIAGGYRLTDPAADLAVAAALISAFSERPVPADAIVFGELSLSGEVRPVAHDALRLREAAKLGFSKRSEERRVGKEWCSTCRSRRSPDPEEKKKEKIQSI